MSLIMSACLTLQNTGAIDIDSVHFFDRHCRTNCCRLTTADSFFDKVVDDLARNMDRQRQVRKGIRVFAIKGNHKGATFHAIDLGVRKHLA